MLRTTHQSFRAPPSQGDAPVRLTGMDDHSPPAAGHGRPPSAERVWREFLAALDELPADARAVLLLHDVYAIAIDEVAAMLGLSSTACNQRLRRARQCLQGHAHQLEKKNP